MKRRRCFKCNKDATCLMGKAKDGIYNTRLVCDEHCDRLMESNWNLDEELDTKDDYEESRR